MTGMYAIAERIQRTVPTTFNPVTNEMIHPSVLCQRDPNPEALKAIEQTPQLVWRLLPHEEIVKEHWQVKRAATDSVQKQDSSVLGHIFQDVKAAVKDGEHLGHALIDTLKHKGRSGQQQSDGALPADHPLAKYAEESSMGKVVKEVLNSAQ